jgi:hypothetical protein
LSGKRRRSLLDCEEEAEEFFDHCKNDLQRLLVAKDAPSASGRSLGSGTD